jgi:hypothetical protein
MVNNLRISGDLTPPLPIPGTDFPIVQYADDTLLILQACPRQLLALRELLQVFAAATGLRVNYSKSCLMPINVDDYQIHLLANIFGCSVGVLPFAYLGLPLGTTRPTVKDLTPIVDQIERRLNASSRFLDYGGRLQLVNSVLSSLPNHYLSSLKIHKTIIKIADRSRRHCLWAKEEESGSAQSLAAWSLVCRPKKKGGLGIINFEVQNQALLLKHLHKFYSKADIPWVKLVWSLYSSNSVPHAQTTRGSFWWRDIFKLSNIYRSITSTTVASGDTVLFWKDFWNSDVLLCDRYPRLFSYSLNEDISVADFIGADDRFNLFALPLSTEAFEELSDALRITQDFQLQPDAMDARSFCWGGTAYTSAKFYKFIFDAIPTNRALNSIWESRCLPKLKVFLWLVMMDRLNTQDIMLRKNWTIDGDTLCVMCNTQALETSHHLFFECPFAVNCWQKIQITWDTSVAVQDRILLAHNQFTGPCFTEILACATWNIWKERNDFIFRGQDPSFPRWRVRFSSDLSLHKYKIKENLVQPLADWIQECLA